MAVGVRRVVRLVLLLFRITGLGCAPGARQDWKDHETFRCPGGEAGMSDRYRIPPSWPASPVSEGELTSEQILDVLDQVSDVYEGALESLAETVVPGEVMT